MPHTIKAVVPASKYQLKVFFRCGEMRQYDFSYLIDNLPIYKHFLVDEDQFNLAHPSEDGTAVVWNEYLDCGCEELWRNGKTVKSSFDSLISCSDAAVLWKIDESTIRKAISGGKLKPGVDIMKFGKQWVVTAKAMKREFGDLEAGR